jgi:hypothetical protein
MTGTYIFSLCLSRLSFCVPQIFKVTKLFLYIIANLDVAITVNAENAPLIICYASSDACDEYLVT